MLNPDELEKRPFEERLYDFQFGAFPEFQTGGQTGISTVNAIEIVPASELVAGVISFSGTRAQVKLTGGVTSGASGGKYLVRCKITTAPDSLKLQGEGLIEVVEPTA